MKTGGIRAQRHSVTEVKRHRGTEASGRRDKLRHKETANSNGVVCNGHTCLYLFLFKWLILLFVFVGGMACSDSDHHGPASLPTGGKLVIGVDESLRPFVEAEIDVFSNDYPDAEITPLYLPEKRVVEKLLENEIQTGIICRDLSREESAYISGRYRHSPTTFKLADDRIVAVVNPANPIETISYGDLEKYYRE